MPRSFSSPEGGHPATYAGRYCIRCPVWEECARYAWRVDGWSTENHGSTGPTHVGGEGWHRVRPGQAYATMVGTFAGLGPRERGRIDSEEAMVAAAGERLVQIAMSTDDDEGEGEGR